MTRAPLATHLRRWSFVALLLCSPMLTTGCATTQQVQEIVKGSNAALLSQTQAAQARVLADAPMPSGKTGSWKDEVSRIEAFISANSDQPVTVNTLRLRQALVLTVFRQDNLALDAFNLIDSSQLRTERDKALYALHQHLVWWFRLNGETMKGDAMSNDADTCGDFCQARTALDDFVQESDTLTPGGGIRYWLEEMRAWIASQLAQELPAAREDEAQQVLSTSLDRFAAQFNDTDIEWLKSRNVEAAESAAAQELPIPILRFRLRARAVVDEYRKAAEGLDPDWSKQQTQALLAAIPASE